MQFISVLAISGLFLLSGCFHTKPVSSDNLNNILEQSTETDAHPVGQPMAPVVPPISAYDIDGAHVSSQDILSGQRSLVIFYRGGWCPYCNNYIQQVKRRYDDFKLYGIKVLFISVDAPDSSQTTVNKHDLPFEVLSDPELNWHRFFNVTKSLSDNEVRQLKYFGMNVEQSSGQKHHVIAHPGIFAIDADMTIRYAYADEDYKVRPSPDQLLNIAKELNWLSSTPPPATKDMMPTQDTNPPKEANTLPKKKAYTKIDQLGRDDGLGLDIGEHIPDLHVMNHLGQHQNTEQLFKDQKTLLVFYRGGWCPYCNQHIYDVTKAYQQFQEHGVQVVFVSVDHPTSAAKTKASYEIPFPVLSDSSLALVTFFNVLNPLDDAYLEKLKSFNIDIEGASGKTHHTLPHPALFAIDEDMKIQFSHVNTDHTQRVSIEQMHSVLAQLGWLK